MATTITVNENTRMKLQELKTRRGIRSFDELLSEIADRELELPTSLYGKGKGLRKAFERDHEERA